MIKPTFGKCIGLFLALFSVIIAKGQDFISNPQSQSASEIKQGLEKLEVLGSVLYFAAHPDDENTRLIAWLANERKYRTAYLSLTRGDGGQNLLGQELGIELGLIRTHEMLAARKYDLGEQFFSAAYDFGFSKTHTETFSFWNKEEILKEAVYIIRKFRPDVIINRFPPDERGGHGHHQASAILAREAFSAAADPQKFPEQVKELGVWQVKRMVWNTANFGGQNNISNENLKVEIGHFNTLLGKSYGEMAAMSRSQHKSQGFGAAATRGNSVEYFEHVAGEKAVNDLMDGVETSWQKVENGDEIQREIQKINELFNYKSPEKSIPALISLFNKVQKISDNSWREQKSTEIQNLILACAGIHSEAYTTSPEFVKNQAIPFQFDIIVRQSDIPVKLLSLQDKSVGKNLNFNEISRESSSLIHSEITQPFWLRKKNSLGKFDIDSEFYGQTVDTDGPTVQAVIQIYDHKVPVNYAVNYKFVDPVQGELYEPIRLTDEITAKPSTQLLLFSNPNSQTVEIEFTKHGTSDKFEVEVESEFSVEPKTFSVDFKEGKSFVQKLTVQVPQQKNLSEGQIKLKTNNQYLKDYRLIRYTHIPTLSWQPDFNINLKFVDVKVPVKRIAYLNGAGDLVGQSLKNLGITVENIQADQLNLQNLQNFEALIIGVRAYNIDPQLFEKHTALMEYVENGGVVLVQYQVNGRFPVNKMGPYAFEVSRSRVTEEDAKVHFLLPNDPILNYPNKLTEKDFENWVQERGLYFVENADSKYRQPLGMHDVNEKMHEGSLIVTQHGKGKFVYTSLSLFRQIPAGVPGSYRLLMNLLAK